MPSLGFKLQSQLRLQQRQQHRSCTQQHRRRGKLTPPTSSSDPKTCAKDSPPQHPPTQMRVKERGFNWRSTYRRTSRTSTAGHHGNRRCTTGNADTDGVNDLDNALGGSYNHPQRGSRPRVSDQQLFNYIWPLCARHYCSYYIRPRPHETGTDRQRSDYVAAPLFLNGLSVGLTERSLSPTYDTHVALGLGTPTHPLAANCHSYLQN